MIKITAQDAFDKKLWEQPDMVVSETDVNKHSVTDFMPLYELLDMKDSENIDDVDLECTGTGADFETIPMEDHRGSGCLKKDDEVFVYIDYRTYLELEARYDNLKREIFKLLEFAVDSHVLSVHITNKLAIKWELHKHD